MRFIRTLTEPKVLSTAEVEVLIGKLADFSTRAPIVLLYLHGAHAQGVQGPLSDVDLAVLLDETAVGDPVAQLDLLSSLQGMAGREDVDLIVLNGAGPIIKERVVRYGRLVYERTARDRLLFEAGAIKEALDFRHFSRVYDDALFRQLSEGRFLG